MDNITLREDSNQEANIRVSDHQTDLSDSMVYAYAYPKYLQHPKFQVGSAIGTEVGTDFVIPVNASNLEPGIYDVELVANDKLVIYPVEQNEKLKIKILNSKFN